MITIDFETKPIMARPEYPPKPVGVAIKHGDGPGEYLAWGHPTENNCTRLYAYNRLARIWRGSDSLLFHNAAFDLDVAQTHFHLPWPSDDRVNDTLVLAYLFDPRAKSLSLKPLAESLLGEPPTEQDRLRDWILANVLLDGRKMPPKRAMAHIWRAPAGLVGEYAIGDVDRTRGLYKRFRTASIVPLQWYRQIEIPLLPVKVGMETTGIKLDLANLRAMRGAFMYELVLVNSKLCEAFNTTPDALATGEVNLGSRQQLADLLEPFVDEWELTPSGQRSVQIGALRRTVNNPKLVRALEERSVLNHYLNGFIHPWLERGTDRLHTTFHTTRGDDSTGGYGTRSGRFSSSQPNLENIAANPEESTNGETLVRLQKRMFKNSGFVFRGLRDVFIADEGYKLVGRDYKQQELRVAAHFDPTGRLQKQYADNPNLNLHQLGFEALVKAGIDLPHKAVKIVVFQTLYGAGIKALAKYLDLPPDNVKTIRDTIFSSMPGIMELNNKLKKRGNLTTWGGRWYESEKPRMIEGEMRSFEYKLLNLLVQGSSADCTKAAMVTVAREMPEFTMLLQEHDELIGQSTGDTAKVNRRFAECMESPVFKVPMLTDGKTGETWARMT